MVMFWRKTSSLNAEEKEKNEFSTVIISMPPLEFTCPEEVSNFCPSKKIMYATFFRNTPKETTQRKIFMDVKLTKEEISLKNLLNSYCADNNYVIPSDIEPYILHILLYNKSKYSDKDNDVLMHKCLTHMKQMFEWRRSIYPLYDQDYVEELNKGIMYWEGRDMCMRPLLIIKMNKFNKHITFLVFQKLIFFSIEWAIRYLLIGGKVETFSVLLDIRQIPFVVFTLSQIKNLIEILSKFYAFRLHKLWILYDMCFMEVLWNLVKQFISKITIEKIATYYYRIGNDIFEEFLNNQIEKSYGGTRDDVTSFYPFPLAPGPFDIDCHKGSNSNTHNNSLKTCDMKLSRGLSLLNKCLPSSNSCKEEAEYTTFEHLSVDSMLNINEKSGMKEDVFYSGKLNEHEKELLYANSSSALYFQNISGPFSSALSKRTEQASDALLQMSKQCSMDSLLENTFILNSDEVEVNNEDKDNRKISKKAGADKSFNDLCTQTQSLSHKTKLYWLFSKSNSNCCKSCVIQ